MKRSRAGLRAVSLSLAVLGAAAVAQTIIFVASGSVALLADLIHNFGDAATAIPLGIAFLMRSQRAERYTGLFVVAAIFISACVAGAEAVSRLITSQEPTHLWALAGAGLIGFSGNWVAARIRARAGKRLDSPSLIADGDHARADAYVSLAVIASAAFADPLIGLGITVVILRITRHSWRTVRGHEHMRCASPIAGGPACQLARLGRHECCAAWDSGSVQIVKMRRPARLWHGGRCYSSGAGCDNCAEDGPRHRLSARA